MLAALMAAVLSQAPGCEAPVWGTLVEAFESRLQAYVKLRSELERGVSPPAQHELAVRMRAARAGARQGAVFSAPLVTEIKKSLRREIDPRTLQMIMGDNPGELPSQVNDEYARGRPLSTMPPNILAALPKLPVGIEYRFVERHLILLDTKARLIIDRIPYAISATTASCR